MQVYLANKTKLVLESAPFNSGGQGSVYRFDARVHPNLRLRIAKLPRPQNLTADYEARIQYMCAHRPALASLPTPDALAWPEECLYDQVGAFIGFVLPFVGGAREVEILCTPHGTSDARFKQYFGLNASGRQQRMRAARSFVDALAALEAAGDYVCTDLKPQNALVKPTGEVTVIDLDNLQIRENGTMVFPATGYTAEYPPPEFYQGRVDLDAGQVEKSFERFSMAVVLYRLLFNIHPYMSTSDAADLMDAIRRGYFVHGPKAGHIRIAAPPHQEFLNEDPGMQQLFLLAFDDGSRASQRPSAAQWSALFAQLGARPIPVSPHHARAAWAAQHRIPLPTGSGFKGWERASVWNPHPPRRKGFRSTDLLVDPTPCDSFDVDDPVTGVHMHADVYPIWLVYAFAPTIVGKRVLLTFRVPPRLVARGNFVGGGVLGRVVPSSGSCMRDIYDTFTFRLRYFPRGAKLLSRERWLQRRLALRVEVAPQVHRALVAKKSVRPLNARGAPAAHPTPRSTHPAPVLRAAADITNRGAVGLARPSEARSPQLLRMPRGGRPEKGKGR